MHIGEHKKPIYREAGGRTHREVSHSQQARCIGNEVKDIKSSGDNTPITLRCFAHPLLFLALFHSSAFSTHSRKCLRALQTLPVVVTIGIDIYSRGSSLSVTVLLKSRTCITSTT